MITIISGVPGSGKTALIVDMAMGELKQGRKVFVVGVPDLLLNVQKGGDPHDWQKGTWLKIDGYDPDKCKAAGMDTTWFPRDCNEKCPYLSTCPRAGIRPHDAGALVIIDESHIHFPQRASGKAPPPYVEALNVHRHQGLDFWFVTQRPSFLDPFIRGLCSRHIHIAPNPFSLTGARNRYEWVEYQESVNRTSKMLAAKSSYKPSPAAFPLYASATVHTRLDQSMPTILKLFIVACVALVVAGYMAVQRVNAHLHSSESQAAVVPAALPPLPVAAASAVPVAAAVPSPSGAVVPVLLAQPTKAVVLGVCLASSSRCQCYTRGGAAVVLDEVTCRYNAEHTSQLFSSI